MGEPLTPADVLRQVLCVRRSLLHDTLLTLIHSLVVRRLDYCSSVLAVMPEAQVQRLNSVLNAAARLVFYASKNKYITPLLRPLHRLKLEERIQLSLPLSDR
jgi:hypothetical protein